MNNNILPVISAEDTDVVWLDLDDTLIDFHANSRRALARLYREEGLHIYYKECSDWIDTYERHNHALWADYSAGLVDRATLRMERFRRPFAEAGADDATARKLSAEYDTLYLDFLAQEKELVPGSIELLTRIHAAGLPVGILSNGFVDVQHRKIANAGLAPYIDFTVLSDDIGVNKPDTRLYRHAMERSGFPSQPQRHIMIGDNADTDITGAIASGWRAIHFAPDGPKLPSRGCPTVASLADIKVTP